MPQAPLATTLAATPSAEGFRMPGEFEPHSGCWMAWPERPDNWREGAGPARRAFAAVAAAIHASDPVTVTVSSAEGRASAQALLPAGIRILDIPSDDCWMRDIGPSFLTGPGGKVRAIDWRFNAWGGEANGLYAPWDLDDAMAARIAEVEGVERYRAPFVLEGGAIHVDGEGTVFTTAECLLSAGRNPQMTQDEIEQGLKDWLGATAVVWLPRGVHLDETDGHVDNLLHVCAPATVALTWTDDKGDPQYERSAEALEHLSACRDARGRPLRVVRLPMPGPLHMSALEAAGIAAGDNGMARSAGERLAGSYANFYIANTRVVFPLLDERHDAEAAAILAGLFPGREIVGVPGREVLLGGGNIHCITQQVPA